MVGFIEIINSLTMMEPFFFQVETCYYPHGKKGITVAPELHEG